MRLWLVRHGVTEATLAGRYAGHGDLPLSPEGIDQAKDLARIVPGGLEVWSSDLLRARQTAELAGGSAAKTSPDFRELWTIRRTDARCLAVIRREAAGDALLVTHAGPIKVLLLLVLGLPLSSVHMFHVDAGSASVVDLWEGGATLRMLNVRRLP